MPAPRLEEYDVANYEACWCEDMTVPAEAKSTCIRSPSSLPAIRSLTISPLYFPLRASPGFDNCPSNLLRELSIAFPPYVVPDLAATLRLLAVVPNIQALGLLNVDFCRSTHTECPNVEGLDSVHLHRLRALHVTTTYNHEICFKWLTLVDMPNLQTVDINQSQAWQRELFVPGPQLARLTQAEDGDVLVPKSWLARVDDYYEEEEDQE